MFRLVRYVAAPGSKSAVSGCILLLLQGLVWQEIISLYQTVPKCIHLTPQFFFLLRSRLGKELWSASPCVCLSVCLSVRISQKPHVQICATFFHTIILHVVVILCSVLLWWQCNTLSASCIVTTFCKSGHELTRRYCYYWQYVYKVGQKSDTARALHYIVREVSLFLAHPVCICYGISLKLMYVIVCDVKLQ